MAEDSKKNKMTGLNGKRIYMYANFGRPALPPAGGGQNAARRLRDTLTKLGYRLETCNRHRPARLDTWKGQAYKYMFALIDPLLWMWFLLWKPRSSALVLFMSYCGPLLPFDFMITAIARILGFRCVFYYAGGGGRRLYDEGSNAYRWLLRRTMRLFRLVMAEGEDTATLVQSIAGVETFHLPNYTEDGFAPTAWPRRTLDAINLCYFGRIDPTKNILLIIDIFERLCRQAAPVSLQLIGSGEPTYERLVRERIALSPFTDRISWLPRTDHRQLRTLMPSQHFFVFPSQEPREGHSNALNEAMAWGVVPVVSTCNFLADIVGNPSLVVERCEAEAFAATLTRLFDPDIFHRLSEEMYQRVRTNFTQTVVEERLGQVFNKVFGSVGVNSYTP